MDFPLPAKRNLHFNKQVNQSSIGDLVKSIVDINEDDAYYGRLSTANFLNYDPQPIKVHIDSYGGLVYQCLGLLGVMQSSKTPIHTIVTGVAMSCGFLTSITGHKRYCYKHSTFLYHQVSTGMTGTLKDLESEMVETRRLQDFIERHTLQHTKMSKKKLKEIYEMKQDYYIDAKTALEYGIVDEII